MVKRKVSFVDEEADLYMSLVANSKTPSSDEEARQAFQEAYNVVLKRREEGRVSEELTKQKKMHNRRKKKSQKKGFG
jgi:hypothetical protein